MEKCQIEQLECKHGIPIFETCIFCEQTEEATIQAIKELTQKLPFNKQIELHQENAERIKRIRKGI